MMKNRLEFKAENKHIDIKIYGNIGRSWWDEEEKIENNVTKVSDLERLLNENKNSNTIDIFINSTGGSVFEGVAIYNILKRHKAYKRVFIDGFACSIASVIAMAGNQVIMPKSSLMMIHNAWTIAIGNAKEFRKTADDLDVINELIINAYKTKVNISDKKLRDLLDEESYLSADECLKYGLCTKVEEDEEDTQNKVELALNETVKTYSNKLEQLETIKNAIKELTANESEIVEVEPDKETLKVEDGKETETIKELEEDVKENAKKQVEEVKDNLLKRFFNLEEKE